MKSFHLEGVPDGLVKELKGGLAFTGRSRFLRRNALPDFQTRILLGNRNFKRPFPRNTSSSAHLLSPF